MKSLMKTARVTLSILLVLVFSTANAAEFWSGNTTITKLYPYSANAFVFNTMY